MQGKSIPYDGNAIGNGDELCGPGARVRSGFSLRIGGIVGSASPNIFVSWGKCRTPVAVWHSRPCCVFFFRLQRNHSRGRLCHMKSQPGGRYATCCFLRPEYRPKAAGYRDHGRAAHATGECHPTRSVSTHFRQSVSKALRSLSLGATIFCNVFSPVGSSFAPSRNSL
jgi:hypothetical protein